MLSLSEGRQCVSRSSDVLSTEAGGEVALMSIPNGRYYALNPFASAIWRKLEQPASVAQLAAKLAAEYNGDPAQIENDLRDTLQEWLSWRLIIPGVPDLNNS
jgi:hypothetical protein